MSAGVKAALFASAIVTMVVAAPAPAQGVDERIARLEERLRRQDARIAELEALVAPQSRTDGDASAARPPASVAPAMAQSVGIPEPIAGPAVGSVPAGLGPGAKADHRSRLDISGDVRLRYEANWSDADARNRGRAALRARLRASYTVTDFLTVGGQMATGDPDDPNSTDVTLSNFDDDALVSLDQAYARLDFGALTLHGGKIPQVFTRTDLVWDGDVSPQGLSAIYELPLGATKIDLRGLYFLVDESVAGPDGDMIGGQLTSSARLADEWQLDLAAGYFDYTLRSVAGADGGDLRSNLIGANGRYLSDFDLLDAIASVTYSGLGERWPVRVGGDYVHNFGAATSADTGYSVDLAIGRANRKGDWRFGYGFAVAQTDAVLAAFSNDNLGIATNYRLHSLTIDYVPWDHVVLNAILYHYRPENVADAGANDPEDWLNRLRLNFLVSF